METFQPKFFGVVAVKGIGTRVDTALVKHRDDADVDAGGLCLAESLRPDCSVTVRASAEELAVEIRKVHRGSERSAKHIP